MLLTAILLGLVLVLSVVLFFSAAKLLNSESVKEKLQAYLFDKAGANIKYGNSELQLFPLPKIIFHQVDISIPGKAEGSVTSLIAYPDLCSLMKGRVLIEKVGLESPHFSINISEKTEELTLEEIEKKVRAVVHYLSSTMPGLSIAVRDGKLDLTTDEEAALSFDMIQAQLRASRKTLDIELTGRSNLWDDCSISLSTAADDLKSKGIIRLKNLRPDTLIARLSKETAEQIGVSGVDLSVNFEASGLRAVIASMESSVSGLAVSREKKRIALGDTTIKGSLEIRPDAVAVDIKQAKVSRPALNLSGQYNLNRSSGDMTVNLEGESITVGPVRKAALDLASDIPLVRSIFTFVQGGDIPSIHFHTTGKSADELGRTANIRITGKMQAGTIYIETPDLTFQNVAGDVVIANGILEGSNVGGFLGKHRCSGGNLRVGLKGKDAPFRLDTRVKADAEQLPGTLKHKNLLKNEAVLHEMERLHDIRGSAEGRLTLGDRLDSIHVKIAVDNINITARYEPLPFPLAVTGGQLLFDEKTLAITNSAGSIGMSSFSALTARLSLTKPYDLSISGGKLSVSADEIYPWLTSFEKVKPVLQDVRSVKGAISVSSLDLRGPLYQPKDWKFHVNGDTKNLNLDASFLPDAAEEMTGTFAVTQKELSLKSMKAKISDSLITVTGTVREFPSDIRSYDLALEGNVGPKVTAWITALIDLPSEMKIRAPFSVNDAVLSIEKDRKTAFSGRLAFGQGTQVSLNVTKTPDSTSIRNLTVKDHSHEFEANINLNRETIDTSFRGTLASQALNSIFSDSIYSAVSLEGDLKAHIVIAHPSQSTADGRLKGENIPVPWDRDIPLVVRQIALEAKGQNVVIDAAEIAAGGMTFKAKGTLSCLPSWFAVNMDLWSNGIDWETFENMLQSNESPAQGEKTGFMKDFPLRGSLKLRSDFLRFKRFKWEPFNADLSFNGKTLLITAKKAALCGISTTGSVGITKHGLQVDAILTAQDLAFEPTVLCLTDKNVDLTGVFQMEAHLKGKGKLREIGNRLGGTFTLSSKDGKILKAKQLDRTFDLLNESENFKGQFPDLNREVISYTDLKLRGVILEQRIQIEDGMLDTSAMRIIASGYLDLGNETVDINAFVSPLKRFHQVVQKIPVLGHVTGGTLMSIPVKISGDIKDPQITFMSLSAIGSGTLGILERTLKLPITLVEPIFPSKNKK